MPDTVSHSPTVSVHPTRPLSPASLAEAVVEEFLDDILDTMTEEQIDTLETILCDIYASALSQKDES